MRRFSCSVLMVAAALFFSHAAAGGSIRTVATFGRTIGGTPFIDAFGRTAFILSGIRVEAPSDPLLSSLTIGSVPELSDAGLYYETQIGIPELIARGSQPAPGMPAGVNYGFIQTLYTNPKGHVAFRTSTRGPGLSTSATFAVTPGGSGRLVFHDGQQLIAPETGAPNGYRYVWLAPARVDDNGYAALLVYPGNGLESAARVLREGPNGVSMLGNTLPVQTTTRATSGQPSIPTTLDVIARNISFISSSADGSTVFRANLQPPVSHNTNFQSTNAIIRVNPAGQLEPLALQRQEFAQGTFNNFGHPAINGQGEVAFYSTWAATPNGSGILRESEGKLEVAVQVGDLVPALGPDATISSILETTYLNDRGDVAFGASLAGSSPLGTNFALYLQSRTTGLTQLVRYADQAPGTNPGTRFGVPELRNLVLNNEGQAAFYATLYGGGRSNDAGIWAYDRDGDLQLIARVGDLLDVSSEGEPADLRTIATLSFNAGNFYGAASGTGFNDNGQVAFAAQFTDGTRGIFVSNAVAVPEPATVAILLLGVAAAIGLRKPSHRD